ncbi:hypothetical protein KR222_004441 [Zaprionus bogoriensis]|nr:hypothetical protein KR222_004441 [Zaprionus bogoriensis]
MYNKGGNTVLQNEAGSIHTGPDGRTVLIGANGQTLVSNGDDSDEDDSDDDDDVHFSGNFHSNNVVINGRSIRDGSGGIFTGGDGTLLVNHGGEGSFQSYNNYQLRILNGGLQLTTGGKVYNFPPKDTNSQEKIDINGQPATVEYNNGNIVVQLADGTVLAKADNGLFSGNRQSFDNRKKIQENAAREAARVQENLAQFQKDLHLRLGNQMRQLQEDLERTLGNIRI